MVSKALRALMVSGEGSGELTGSDVLRASAEHPICGDRVQVTLRCADAVITDFAWRAAGCPATLAIVAAAAQIAVGVSRREFASRLHQQLATLGGIDAHEQHAEKMVVRAVEAAFGSS